MKTFELTILPEADLEKVLSLLNDMADKQLIVFQEKVAATTSPSFDQVEEMIDESELGPYYTEEEARNILHL